MIAFRSWTGGQLFVFSAALAFAGLLLFLGYRSWETQYQDAVGIYNSGFKSATEACRIMTTEQCNAIMRPYEDAMFQRIRDASLHFEKAGVIRVVLVLLDLIVIPAAIAYMAFQWLGAQRRTSGSSS